MTAPRALRAPKLTEADYQAAIITIARTLGYETAHVPPVMSARGRWGAQGATGLPDLLLARPGRCVWAELKSAGGKVSPAQQKWLDVLRASGQEVHLWRVGVDSVQDIASILQARRPSPAASPAKHGAPVFGFEPGPRGDIEPR